MGTFMILDTQGLQQRSEKNWNNRLVCYLYVFQSFTQFRKHFTTCQHIPVSDKIGQTKRQIYEDLHTLATFPV